MDKPEQKFKVGDRVYCNGGSSDDLGPDVLQGATITEVTLGIFGEFEYCLEYDNDRCDWYEGSFDRNLVLKSTIDEMFESYNRVYGK